MNMGCVHVLTFAFAEPEDRLQHRMVAGLNAGDHQEVSPVANYLLTVPDPTRHR
jgi:hypothetical protein